jgi:hypothetical protein
VVVVMDAGCQEDVMAERDLTLSAASLQGAVPGTDGKFAVEMIIGGFESLEEAACFADVFKAVMMDKGTVDSVSEIMGYKITMSEFDEPHLDGAQSRISERSAGFTVADVREPGRQLVSV